MLCLRLGDGKWNTRRRKKYVSDISLFFGRNTKRCATISISSVFIVDSRWIIIERFVSENGFCLKRRRQWRKQQLGARSLRRNCVPLFRPSALCSDCTEQLGRLISSAYSIIGTCLEGPKSRGINKLSRPSQKMLCARGTLNISLYKAKLFGMVAWSFF